MSTFKFKKIDEARYWEMLGILPPREYLNNRFLVGEPYSSARCQITGKIATTYSAFFCTIPDEFEKVVYGREEAYFEAVQPLTVAEFRSIRMADILANIYEPVATNRPGDAAAIMAENERIDYATALVRCNMD